MRRSHRSLSGTLRVAIAAAIVALVAGTGIAGPLSALSAHAATPTSTPATAAELRADADAMSTKYFSALERYRALQQEIDENLAAVSSARAEANEAREAAKERAQIAYRMTGVHLAAVVEPDDTIETARKVHLIDQVTARDNEIFERLSKSIKKLDDRREALDAAQADQAKALDQLQDTGAAIDAKLAAAAALERQAADAAATTTTTSAAPVPEPSGARGIEVLPNPTSTTQPFVPPPPPPPPPYNPGGGVHPQHDHPTLACIRWRESNGNYGVVSSNGLWYGAYQFSRSTWNSTANHAGRPELVGVAPNVASQYDQDDMAWTLLQWQGLGPWGGSCG